jgi:hypothetical protein
MTLDKNLISDYVVNLYIYSYGIFPCTLFKF